MLTLHHGIYNKHAVLALGRQKFAIDKLLALWARGLSMIKQQNFP